MPTMSEMSELYNSKNCTWQYTTRNCIPGLLITSKKSGYEGRSIFLPATSKNPNPDVCYGTYWSRTLRTTDKDQYAAYYLMFEVYYHDFLLNYGFRCDEMTIRPVCP